MGVRPDSLLRLVSGTNAAGMHDIRTGAHPGSKVPADKKKAAARAKRKAAKRAR